MENLLKKDFVSHHYLPVCSIEITQNVNHSYFD